MFPGGLSGAHGRAPDPLTRSGQNHPATVPPRKGCFSCLTIVLSLPLLHFATLGSKAGEIKLKGKHRTTNFPPSNGAGVGGKKFLLAIKF